MSMNRQTAIGMLSSMYASMNPSTQEIVRSGVQDFTHPQERTREFHHFYDAPIHEGPITKTFEHMSNERVAFRIGFIIEELRELLNDGFGIQMRPEFIVVAGDEPCEGDVDTYDLIEAIQSPHTKRDIVGVVDALGDLNVVVNGFALELGVDMNAVDREICASNFTKMGEGGNPIIGDGKTGPVGKVLKGPNFVKPNITAVLGIEP